MSARRGMVLRAEVLVGLGPLVLCRFLSSRDTAVPPGAPEGCCAAAVARDLVGVASLLAGREREELVEARCCC